MNATVALGFDSWERTEGLKGMHCVCVGFEGDGQDAETAPVWTGPLVEACAALGSREPTGERSTGQASIDLSASE